MLFWQRKTIGRSQSGSHVRRLVERAGVRRPVAEAHDCHAVEALALGRHRQPDAHRRACTDDPRREHHAHLGFGDVHGAALAAARADGAAIISP